jgi:hypothetical protein
MASVAAATLIFAIESPRKPSATPTHAWTQAGDGLGVITRNHVWIGSALFNFADMDVHKGYGSARQAPHVVRPGPHPPPAPALH